LELHPEGFRFTFSHNKYIYVLGNTKNASNKTPQRSNNQDLIKITSAVFFEVKRLRKIISSLIITTIIINKYIRRNNYVTHHFVNLMF
jgi:hypothetical protein